MKQKISFLISGLLVVTSVFGQSPQIDVVIPCHEKDARTLEWVLEGIRNNVHGIRKIFVISAKKLTHNAQWFDESWYPFTHKSVALTVFAGNQQDAENYMQKPDNRIGWIYQQLLKLYAPLVIPDILPNVLVVDADTIFLRPIELIDADGCTLFNVGPQYEPTYFGHMRRLLPDLTRVFPEYSGITHHMLLQRHILDDLFNEVRSKHQTEPWKALCTCIDKQDIFASISEYEIYFNYVFSHNYKAKIRKLYFVDKPFNEGTITWYKNHGCDYISCHSWML